MAENGADAIRQIEARAKTLPEGSPPFDLILSDVLMPEVDGFMLLRWMRSSANSPDKFIPLAMISGAADAGFVARARDLGANEFIAKPFSTQAVWERLMNIVYKPRRFVRAEAISGRIVAVLTAKLPKNDAKPSRRISRSSVPAQRRSS